MELKMNIGAIWNYVKTVHSHADENLDIPDFISKKRDSVLPERESYAVHNSKLLSPRSNFLFYVKSNRRESPRNIKIGEYVIQIYPYTPI